MNIPFLNHSRIRLVATQPELRRELDAWVSIPLSDAHPDFDSNAFSSLMLDVTDILEGTDIDCVNLLYGNPGSVQ